MKSLPFRPSHPLLGILNLSNAMISVFPQGEEFLVMVYGFGAQEMSEVSDR